jgi:hypothetical protein
MSFNTAWYGKGKVNPKVTYADLGLPPPPAFSAPRPPLVHQRVDMNNYRSPVRGLSAPVYGPHIPSARRTESARAAARAYAAPWFAPKPAKKKRRSELELLKSRY